MQNPRIPLQILLISMAIFVSHIFNSTIKNTFMENSKFILTEYHNYIIKLVKIKDNSDPKLATFLTFFHERDM